MDVHIHDLVEDLDRWEVYCSGCSLRGIILTSVTGVIWIRVGVGTEEEP